MSTQEPVLSNPGLSADQGEASYAFPLTFAQSRLWFLEQLEPNGTSYLIPWSLRITGTLNAGALERSLNEVVRRHEILRATFTMIEGEPVQIVAASLHIPVPIVDISGHPDREEEAHRRSAEEAQTPLNIEKGPLVRARLLRLADEDHVLLLTLHHIIFDGWSRSIFVRELAAFYEGSLAGSAVSLPELPIQYADYAVWQREHLQGENLEKQLSFWKGQLEGAPTALDLPTDRLRPPMQTYGGASVGIVLSRELTEKLTILSRREGTTLYMTLLAAYKTLLARYSGQDDIVVGAPVANRNRAELESLIGFFANTVVLRTKLEGDPTFRELLRRVRETALSAYAHQEMPFEKLVEELRPERSLNQNPLFQVLFSLRNTPQDEFQLAGLKLRFFGGVQETAKFDISLYLAEQNGELRGRLEYNTDLFDATTIERMVGHYRVLLEGIVEDPDCRIWELPLLSMQERQQMLVEWNATEREYPREKCVHELFEAQVALHPQRTAAVFGSEQLTYRELDQRASRLARCLQSLGARPGMLVGIFLERSLEMLVAMIGVLKAGGAYVPLDPAYPAERIAFMLEDSGAEVLITQHDLTTSLLCHAAKVVEIDLDWSAIALQSGADVVSRANAKDLAYVRYTSGSTGKPKGVMIPHGAVVNFLESMRREPGIKEQDTLVAVTTLSFDISELELWLPLCVGAKVVIASREVAMDGLQLADLLRSVEATVMQATPATWRMLLESGWEGDRKLKILCGGEALPVSLAEQLLRRCAELWNLYGPTETTVWSAAMRVLASEKIVIGPPIANTQFYILDRHRQPVPIGVPGELHIGGEGLAQGYWNRAELTAEKFVADPFSKVPGARLYKTGDLMRFLPNGTIEFLGRIDHQVKIRGFRIELCEIEAALVSHPSIQDCVVIARGAAGEERLAAYVVHTNASPKESPNPADLRAWIKTSLPAYMVPVDWAELEQIPRLPNGKVDRKSLPEPEQHSKTSEFGEAPSTPIQIRLAQIWQEVLKVSRISLSDDFFDLGGHSLLAVTMMGRIREVFGKELPLALLFQAPTLGGLADKIQRERGKYTLPTLIPIRAEGSKPPLFCISRPNANALGFIFLARSLSKDQPVYGLQSQMREDGRFWTFSQEDYEKKATEYIEAMLEVQPDGPYLLAGFCEGAHIGFEMARQLKVMGRTVAMLAILDAWPIENTIDRRRYKIRNFALMLRRFGRMSARNKWKMISRKLLNRNTPIRVEVNGPHQITIDPQFQRRAAEQAEQRYWPGPDFVPTIYSGKITVFRTAHREFHRIKDNQLGWGPRTQGGVEVVPIQGTHRLFLREPYVSDLAVKLEHRIDAALQDASSNTNKIAASVS